MFFRSRQFRVMFLRLAARAASLIIFIANRDRRWSTVEEPKVQRLITNDLKMITQSGECKHSCGIATHRLRLADLEEMVVV